MFLCVEYNLPKSFISVFREVAKLKQGYHTEPLFNVPNGPIKRVNKASPRLNSNGRHK